MHGEPCCALNGLIRSYIFQENERGPEEGLDDHQNDSGNGCATGEMARRCRTTHEEPEQENAQERKSAGDAVGELDNGVKLRVLRDDLAVAKWPVLTASSPGAACANEGSPENHADVVGEESPGVGNRRTRRSDVRGGGLVCSGIGELRHKE